MKNKPQLGRDVLHSLFEYRNGRLYWKINCGRRKTIGNEVAARDKNGYIVVQINRKQYFAHRIIFEMHHGYLPEIVDHHDRDVSNNLIENLRAATNAQNQSNRPASPKNKCGVKGVCWIEKQRKWKAGIKVNQKNVHLGYFDDIKSAGAAYAAAALKYQGEFARFEA